MDLASLAPFFEAFETENVMRHLGQLDAAQLVHNPWLLAALGFLALLSLFMRWRLLLVTLFSVAGFVWLVSYAQQQGTELDGIASDSLLLFIGGGVLLVGAAIYFLFIRSE